MKYLIFFLFVSIGILATGCSQNKKNINTGLNTIKKTENLIKNEKLSLMDGSYILNKETSRMRWEASKIIGAPHRGNIEIKTGNIEIKNGSITGGNFVIDMTSISEDNNAKAFIEHIKSDDFFDVEKFPESNIEINKIIYEMENDNFKVDGLLEIKGITNNLQFITNFIYTEKNILNARSAFSIDRTRWDIKYGSGKFFKELGDKAIKDEILFELDLDFKQ